MKINPDRERDAPGVLPPELRALHEELSRLRLEERPSFAPELRGELARAAREPEPPRTARRLALAATVAGLAFAGVAVPPLRASLVQGVRTALAALQTGAEDTAEPEIPLAPSEEILGLVPVIPDLSDLPAAQVRVEAQPVSPPTRETSAALPVFQPALSSLPQLVDPEAGRQVVRGYYPVPLQEAGIGGTVTLLLWVERDGSVGSVEVAQGSGVAALDTAAWRAAPSLRFRPALRGGVAVGTWATLDLVFDAVVAQAGDEAVAEPVGVEPAVAERGRG
ncbi:MAG: energy transducer TonB [Longimicrobiales bacterium]|nr:energy transducer TonB [Longimicrobiales bacterium]